MKLKTILLAAVVLPMLAMVGCNKGDSAKGPEMKTFEDSVSYAMGWMFGRQVKIDSTNINVDQYAAGFKAGKDSTFKVMNQEKMTELLGRFQAKMQATAAEKAKKQQDEMMKKGEQNKTESVKFLNDNKNKPNVKSTKSGLQYIILKEGTGNTPTSSDMVTIKFTATFIDGKQFDKNDKINVPVKAFKGWEEAMLLTKVGGHYKFFFPPELAFGDKVIGNIPPNSVLIFDVEVLGTEKAPQMPVPNAQAAPRKMR